MITIIDNIYNKDNLIFYIALSIITLCFIIMIIISLIKDNKIKNKETEIELPKKKETIENIDSDTFIKRLEELKKK